jgi:Stealth protein CR2, conserved region 2
MDVVYLIRHSKNEDAELKYSLRSVALYTPWVRKVWIFGDRPRFLKDDIPVVEHVPWKSLSWLRHVQAPVKNFFLQCFLVALHPEVEPDFLLFSDDNVLLAPLSPEMSRRRRYIKDMSESKTRGKGRWKQALWRTYDLLKQMQFPGYNFETHTPIHLTKREVFEAYRDLHDFVTEDRFAGMLGPTGILNHAYKQRPFPLTKQIEEQLSAGFYGAAPIYAEVVEKTRGKLFFNFDDQAFGDDLRRFLDERFPDPCCYERDGPVATAASVSTVVAQQASARFPVTIQASADGTFVATSSISAEATTPELALDGLVKQIHYAMRAGGR